MTRAVLTARVGEIMRLANHEQDDEAAHSAEDQLREDVLQLIADGLIGGDEARHYATVALSTNACEFNRWCA